MEWFRAPFESNSPPLTSCGATTNSHPSRDRSLLNAHIVSKSHCVDNAGPPSATCEHRRERPFGSRVPPQVRGRRSPKSIGFEIIAVLSARAAARSVRLFVNSRSRPRSRPRRATRRPQELLLSFSRPSRTVTTSSPFRLRTKSQISCKRSVVKGSYPSSSRA
jgi:hypothetical protein